LGKRVGEFRFSCNPSIPTHNKNVFGKSFSELRNSKIGSPLEKKLNTIIVDIDSISISFFENLKLTDIFQIKPKRIIEDSPAISAIIILYAREVSILRKFEKTPNIKYP
tara:strand:- start:626 stop:952 length:327 start_codon:yes stop_codon:yes gene_type:complete